MVSKLITVPSNWKIKKMGTLGNVVTGSTPKTSETNNWIGTLPFVSPTDIEGQKYVSKTERNVNKDVVNKNRIIPRNSVMYTCIASIGKLALSISECTTNQQINTVIPNADIDSNFLYYSLLYKTNYIKTLAGMTAVPIINKALFSKIELAIPPTKEQQKIAAILSSVDEAIEKTEVIIEQTETVKKGVMQELLTKGIGHTEFKDTPVGKIPAKWEVLNFNNVFDRITTKNKVDNQNVLTISGEHGLVSQLDYFKKSVSAKNLTNYIYLEKGDFAYNKSYSQGYPLGAIKLLDKYDVGVVSTLYICFRLKDSYVNGFYKYYFDSGNWHRQVYSIAPEGGRSHGLLNVGVKDFFEILIPVPTKDEQKEIYNQINSIDQKIKKEQNKLGNLKRLKQGLMQQLLTGKVRVLVDDVEEVLP